MRKTRAFHLPALLAALAMLAWITPTRSQADDGGHRLWGPVLGNVTPTSIQISWRNGDRSGEGVVFAGKLYAGAADDNYRLVTLADLQPDTRYTYRLAHPDLEGGGADFSCQTAPAQAVPFTFAAYGDTRNGGDTHRKLAAAILELRPRFVLNTGDLVAAGSNPADWDAFFAEAGALTAQAPYFAAAGNHEQNADYFYRLFPGAPGGGARQREWYSLTYGNVHVAVLNSTRNVADQRDWLARDLAANEGRSAWTIVAFHYPPYSSSARNGDATMREQWVPVLEKYKVDVVFLGHDHFYERSEKDGVTYVIAGGGGAPLYDPNSKDNRYQKRAEKCHHFLRADVTAATLRLRMIRLDGAVGDEVTLRKPAGAAQRQPGPAD